MFKSIFLLTLNWFLRVGEKTNVNKNVSFNHISMKQENTTIQIITFKNHINKPFFHPTGNEDYCPV